MQQLEMADGNWPPLWAFYCPVQKLSSRLSSDAQQPAEKSDSSDPELTACSCWAAKARLLMMQHINACYSWAILIKVMPVLVGNWLSLLHTASKQMFGE